jgi:hypothetical protein
LFPLKFNKKEEEIRAFEESGKKEIPSLKWKFGQLDTYKNYNVRGTGNDRYFYLVLNIVVFHKKNWASIKFRVCRLFCFWWLFGRMREDQNLLKVIH